MHEINISDGRFFDPLPDAGSTSTVEGIRMAESQPNGSRLGFVFGTPRAIDSGHAGLESAIRAYVYARLICGSGEACMQQLEQSK